MVCLGIEIDTVKSTLAVPLEKLQQIIEECHSWSTRKVCTKQQLQSILGLLLYITKCVKHARFFLNRMIDTLKEAKNSKIIILNKEFAKDMAWFNQFLVYFNGTVYFNPLPAHGTFEIDACLQGFGGRYNEYVYNVPLEGTVLKYNICQLEMLNVVVALKVWGYQFKNKKLTIKCDNLPAVNVSTNGKTGDKLLAAIARNI